MTLAEREQYARSVVNRLRKEGGHRAIGKLKKGIPLHPGMCVMAMSLPCRYANRGNLRAVFDSHEERDPELVRFMKDFDNGKYPHLELPKSAIKVKYPGDRKATILYDAEGKRPDASI